MNICKKFLGFITAFICNLCLASALPVMNASGEEYVYGNLKYDFLDFNSDGKDDYVQISGYIEPAKEIEIPAAIDGLPVIIIGRMAFYNCSELENIILPDCVTNIEKDAFKGTALYESLCS